ncbi:uncharacterized protein LOC131653405 [Vicia villosa]|uniref:uncharacterized protein LOC131653405 n=1 Tax=Vicia villosa TaxID=3911 RepID=UPI00273B7011|nr:uncharacterized protein LOC131653405 [Vicia villosa]
MWVPIFGCRSKNPVFPFDAKIKELYYEYLEAAEEYEESTGKKVKLSSFEDFCHDVDPLCLESLKDGGDDEVIVKQEVSVTVPEIVRVDTSVIPDQCEDLVSECVKGCSKSLVGESSIAGVGVDGIDGTANKLENANTSKMEVESTWDRLNREKLVNSLLDNREVKNLWQKSHAGKNDGRDVVVTGESSGCRSEMMIGDETKRDGKGKAVLKEGYVKGVVQVGRRRSDRIYSKTKGKDAAGETTIDGGVGVSLGARAGFEMRSSERANKKRKSCRIVEPVQTKDLDGHRYFSWCKVIECAKVAGRNVLQFPQKVIRDCLDKHYTRVLFRDSDLKKVFKCELHYAKRKYFV